MKYLPGQEVPGGVYWKWLWDLAFIPEEGGTLPIEQGGTYLEEGVTYRKVPILWLMLLGPFIGLTFILFLPIAVPVVMIHWSVRTVAARIGRKAPEPAPFRVPASTATRSPSTYTMTTSGTLPTFHSRRSAPAPDGRPR